MQHTTRARQPAVRKNVALPKYEPEEDATDSGRLPTIHTADRSTYRQASKTRGYVDELRLWKTSAWETCTDCPAGECCVREGAERGHFCQVERPLYRVIF